MSDYQLQKVKSLVQGGEIKEAREILYTLLDDPVAQRWLQKINEVDPPDEKDVLTRAKVLLQEKRFTAARVILKTIPKNATAKQWLTRLDDVAPEKAAEQEKKKPPMPGGTSPVMQAFGDFLRSVYFRSLFASGMAIGAAFLIFSWFTAPWIAIPPETIVKEGEEEIYQSTLISAFNQATFNILNREDVSASQVFQGRNENGKFTLDLGIPTEEQVESGDVGGVSSVRLVDRTLVLIPVFCGILLLLVWLYFTRDRRKRTAPIVFWMTVICGLLAAFPYLWEIGGKEEWKSSIAGSYYGAEEVDAFLDPFMDFLAENAYTFKADTHKLVSLIMVVAGGITWVILFLEQADFFGKPRIRTEDQLANK